MSISGFTYVLGETFKGLYRNRWMCITSTGVVVVTLLMLGLFMIINLNINYITDSVKEQVEIVLYLDEQAERATLEQLHHKLAGHPDIKDLQYVSSEEHLNRLQQQLGGMLEGYDTALENPLLSSYEVQTVVPEAVVQLAAELETYEGVESVFYGQGYVEDLFAVTRIVQIVGLALMAGLAITAVFLISHTIKLTVMMRKKEIAIMKYVGATNWFIRWPFLLEGLLMGFIGAVIPTAALYYLYQGAVEWMVVNNLAFISLLPPDPVIMELARYLLPLGIGLGILGSIFSMSKFLRV